MRNRYIPTEDTLVDAVDRLKRARQDFERAAMRAVKLLAAGRFTGRELADGQIWQRICRDCRSVQPDDNRVNQMCTCGSRVILWEPKGN